MSTYLMQIALWAVSCLEVIICFALLNVFFDIKKCLNVRKIIAIVVCVVAVGSLLAANRQWIFFSNNMWLICTGVISLFSAFITRKYIVLVVELTLIGTAVISLLDFFVLYCVESFYTTSLWSEVYFRTVSWWGILIYSVSRLSMFVLLTVLRKIITQKMDFITLTKSLIPVAVVLCVLIYFFQTLFVSIAKDGLEIKSWLAGLVLISCLALVLLWIIFFHKSIVVENENRVLQISETIQEKRYLDLENRGEENKRIVHDIKNHIVALQGLCKTNDIETVATYLNDMSDMFEEYTETQWCDNTVINTLLNQKIKLAQSMYITWDITSCAHVNIPLNGSEIVTVFGNLLDNAIEACQLLPKDEREISVYIKQRQGIFQMEISNTICVKPKIEGNHISTTKANKTAHGYGLKNVSRVVEKYKGAMSLEATNQMFIVRVSFFETFYYQQSTK